MPFALGMRESLEGARAAVELYGLDHVRRVHALALADALRARIPGAFYARMFVGGGFAARMDALGGHDTAVRDLAPEPAPDTDETALGAFVSDAVSASTPQAPEPAPELPEAALGRALPEGPSEAPPLDMGAELAKLGWVAGGDA